MPLALEVQRLQQPKSQDSLLGGSSCWGVPLLRGMPPLGDLPAQKGGPDGVPGRRKRSILGEAEDKHEEHVQRPAADRDSVPCLPQGQCVLTKYVNLAAEHFREVPGQMSAFGEARERTHSPATMAFLCPTSGP